MKDSLVYRIYVNMKKIYINSKIVNYVSKLLSLLFSAMINSKIFISLSNTNSVLLKRSFICKLYSKIMVFIYSIIDTGRATIDGGLQNSFFVRSFRSLVSDRSKNMIRGLFAFLALTLTFNMLTKVAAGNFTLIGNKHIIALTVTFFILYIFDIDYILMIKESRAFKFFYKITNDVK